MRIQDSESDKVPLALAPTLFTVVRVGKAFEDLPLSVDRVFLAVSFSVISTRQNDLEGNRRLQPSSE